jgi:hypothetical protein
MLKHRKLTTMQKSINAEASDISISTVELPDTGAQATQSLMLKHSWMHTRLLKQALTC